MMRYIVVSILIIVFLGFGGVVQADLSDGLVAYYPFNGDANDTSGNGHHGTVYGATLTEDRFGNADSAFYFDGNQYIIISSALQRHLEVDKKITISANVYIQDWDGIWFPVIGAEDSWELHLQQNSWDDYGIGFTINNPGIGSWGDYYFQLDKWYHIAASYDDAANTVVLYVDGAKITENYFDIEFPEVNVKQIYIAFSPFGADEYSSGKIDDIRIYDRVLSQNEVQQLYEEQNEQENCTEAPRTPTVIDANSISTTAPVIINNKTITLNSPSYCASVDFYIAIFNSADELIFVDSTGDLTFDFDPYASGITSAINTSFPIGSSSLASQITGECVLYWLITPANFGNILQSLNGPYELGWSKIRIDDESDFVFGEEPLYLPSLNPEDPILLHVENEDYLIDVIGDRLDSGEVKNITNFQVYSNKNLEYIGEMFFNSQGYPARFEFPEGIITIEYLETGELRLVVNPLDGSEFISVVQTDLDFNIVRSTSWLQSETIKTTKELRSSRPEYKTATGYIIEECPGKNSKTPYVYYKYTEAPLLAPGFKEIKRPLTVEVNSELTTDSKRYYDYKTSVPVMEWESFEDWQIQCEVVKTSLGLALSATTGGVTGTAFQALLDLTATLPVAFANKLKGFIENPVGGLLSLTPDLIFDCSYDGYIDSYPGTQFQPIDIYIETDKENDVKRYDSNFEAYLPTFKLSSTLEPEAIITASPDSGDAPLTVSLDAGLSTPNSEECGTFEWTTSDGQSSTGLTAQFTFDYEGVYHVDLNIKTENGKSNKASKVIVAWGATPLEISSVSTEWLSSSDRDGQITIVVSGGTPPYQYSVDGGSTYTSDCVINGLDDARYHIVVQDSNGKTAENDAVVQLNKVEYIINTMVGKRWMDDNGSKGTEEYEYAVESGNGVRVTYGLGVSGTSGLRLVFYPMYNEDDVIGYKVNQIATYNGYTFYNELISFSDNELVYGSDGGSKRWSTY